MLLDVRELGKGMDLIRRECSLHDHSVLKSFLQGSDAQLDKLQKDSKAAEVSRLQCETESESASAEVTSKLSHLLTLGSLQQCGELLRRER